VGLNVDNRVPAGAIALAALPGGCPPDPERWCAEVLAALEWAMACAGRPEAVRALAELRLLLPADPVRREGREWLPAGLTADGGLTLACGTDARVIHRDFGAG
jgi:BirA family biotin operon repressor/biotin-[acetyl-CoA-carboxylase] ligase